MVINFFVTLLDPIFSPLLAFSPAVTLFLFAAILTTLIYTLNKLVVNRKVMKELKGKLAVVKESLSKAQKEGNKDEVNKLLNEMMSIHNQNMKHSLKMMMISAVVLIVLFPWASYKFSDVTVASHPFVLGLTSFLQWVPVISFIPWSNWLVWYALSSISISWLLTKFIGD